MKRALVVAVIGGSEPSEEERAWAEEVGRQLARRGAVLVTGGLGGVMEAASKGAVEAGGVAVGILPGSSVSDANSYVTIPIPTGIGYARNAIVAKAGQAIIAIGGAYGTLSEIAHALGDGVPVVGLGTWEFSRGGEPDSSVLRVHDPVEAVERALELAWRRVRKGESP